MNELLKIRVLPENLSLEDTLAARLHDTLVALTGEGKYISTWTGKYADPEDDDDD